MIREWGVVVGGLLLLGGGAWWLHARSEANRLVRSDPQAVFADPQLMRYVHQRGTVVYAAHCAGCHGRDRHGVVSRGIPDLADDNWIYASDAVDLEHTVTYGIRSGHPKSRNVAEMPGMALTRQLTFSEVDDVVEYVLSISAQPHDAEAAERGHRIFFDKGNCFDCHAGDAKGVVDYGVPALTGPSWVYGGDRATLRNSVFGGRHGKCPAWIGVLSPADIRAVAFDLVPPASRPGRNALL